MRESTWLAVGGALVAGALHLAIIPAHGGLRDAHGLAFLVLGLAQLGWAGLWLVAQRRGSWALGLALAGASITLWAVSRFLRAPFSAEAEPVDAAGIVVKLAEATTLVGLVLHEQEQGRKAHRALPWVAAALALGLAAYAGAIAAEPFLPQFSEAPAPLVASPDAVTMRAEHDHEEVALTIDPGPASGASSTFTVQLAVHGSPDHEVRGVNLGFASGQRIPLSPAGAATWNTTAAPFVRGGNATVDVEVDRTWAAPTTVTFDVAVRAGETPSHP